jgi:hypothetical protein
MYTTAKLPFIIVGTSLKISLMELSPSWEAANCAATQELPSILWNAKVHYRVYISPPLIPIPTQINPIRTIPSYIPKIHFNIVHPPTSWSSQWSLTFWLPHQYPICIPLLPIRATFPAHLILLDSIVLIILGEEYKFPSRYTQYIYIYIVTGYDNFLGNTSVNTFSI